jgi:glycosyltransferase involved in cell wall biosynthesis
MRILHFILGKANKERANGVNQVIAGLAKYTARHGAEVRVIGKAESVGSEGEFIARDGFEVQAFSKWNRPLQEAVFDAIGWADIVHLHGVFAPWNLWVAGLCKRLGKPYVITLHDGLDRERLLARGGIKKRLFHFLLQRRHINQAAGIHALTEEEATDVLACASPRNLFCIPNGVDLEDFSSMQPARPAPEDVINIGYLGRLSPEKNLDALCRAAVAANHDGRLRLKLAGPDSAYLQQLLNRYGRYGVEWVGPQYGTDKADFIRSVDMFVHPSLCDVFSIAAMEVLALGIPLLITRTAKASYFYDRQAFFMCEPTEFGLLLGLQSAFSQTSRWPSMAENGRQLIEDRLNWSVAARGLLDEYARIVGKQAA